MFTPQNTLLLLAIAMVCAILWRALIACRTTELKARELRLRFQATFEQAAVGIAHVSLDGRWLRVNDKICQIVGYSREELMKSTFQQITHADDLNADLVSMKQMLCGEISTFSTNKRYYHKQGAIVWIRLTLSLTKKSDGKPDYFIAVIEDITQIKHADAQLRKLNLQADALMEQQVIVQTVLTLAHELNQPLNAAGSYSEAALRLADAEDLNREKLTEVIRYSVAEIQRAGSVMRNLIRNVHQTDHAIETFELIGALNEAIRMFLAEQYENRSVIALEYEHQELMVSANRLGLKKVLMNLLWNAHQAASDTSKLKITVRIVQSRDSAIVSVIDNGPGIASWVAEKLFDPFFTTKSDGVGMGLAISRSLIEGNGGRLWYEPAQDQTAFHFSIKKHGLIEMSRERRIKFRDRRESNRRLERARTVGCAWTNGDRERRECTKVA